ncbi:RNA-directed DNA polymerase, eukaryota [Tanacetum coccineum]
MGDNVWQKVTKKKSKEYLTQRISKSVFITNFFDHFSARYLWNVCVAYGKVIDVYIPLKKSKVGKKFAFVRFMKVDNVDRLIENLCTIWIGSHRLRANPVRFQRESMVSNSQLKKGNVADNTNSFASVLKAGNLKPVMSYESSPSIVLDESCVSEKDLSCSLMGKIKDLANEGFDNVNLTYLGGYWVLINADSISSKEKLSKHMRVASWFVELIPACNSFVSENRLVWVSLEGLPIKLWNKAAFAKIVFQWGTLANLDVDEDSSLPFKKVCVVTNHHTIINDKIKIIIKGKLYWIHVKEFNAWDPEFIDKGSDTSSSDEEDIDGKANDFDSDKELDHISESSCMNDYRMKSKTQDSGNEQKPISEDPFEIYELLNKKKDKEVSNKETSKDEGPTFPPGFTPNVVDDTVDGQVSGSNKFPNTDSHTTKDSISGMKKGSNSSLNLKIGGSILQVMEDLVEVGQTMGYNMEGCLKNIEAIVGLQRDSQLENIDPFAINALWGNFAFDFAISPSVGFSGGLLCVWDPNTFSKESVTISDSFLAIRGTWISSSTKLLIVSVYAPQELSRKKSLWEYISHMIDPWEGESIILGDFNEVRAEHERLGSTFNDAGANAFNRFISSYGLIDLPLEGYSYTWALKPILMRELVVDYGPSPFRVFHSWFSKDGFDKFVEGSWKNLACEESNSILLQKKIPGS